MNEQQIEDKIKKCKREKKWWIFLLCRPIIIFLFWIIAALVFWFINKYNWGSELVETMRHLVNWIFWLLLMLYFLILPVWIILVVIASSDLKKLNKDNLIK